MVPFRLVTILSNTFPSGCVASGFYGIDSVLVAIRSEEFMSHIIVMISHSG